jgi:hypothetical protein
MTFDPFMYINYFFFSLYFLNMKLNTYKCIHNIFLFFFPTCKCRHIDSTPRCMKVFLYFQECYMSKVVEAEITPNLMRLSTRASVP